MDTPTATNVIAELVVLRLIDSGRLGDFTESVSRAWNEGVLRHTRGTTAIEPDYDLILAFSRGIQKSYNMRNLELKEVFIAVTSQVLTLMHATTINNIWERVSAMETLPDDAFLKAVRQKISMGTSATSSTTTTVKEPKRKRGKLQLRRSRSLLKFRKTTPGN